MQDNENEQARIEKKTKRKVQCNTGYIDEAGSTFLV